MGAGVGLIAFVTWGAVVGRLIEARYLRWLLERSERGLARGSALAATMPLGLALLALLVAVTIDRSGNRAMALAIVPFILIACPLIFVTLPSKGKGFKRPRAALQVLGADADEARALAWSGGLGGTVGLVIVTVAVLRSLGL